MFYATRDSDGDYISENADVFAFHTREAAIDYLKSAYDPQFWNIKAAVIQAGRFGDCWIRVTKAPGDNETYYAPFTRDQLYIAEPGQHPGGKAWWIEPRERVLTIAICEA